MGIFEEISSMSDWNRDRTANLDMDEFYSDYHSLCEHGAVDIVANDDDITPYTRLPPCTNSTPFATEKPAAKARRRGRKSIVAACQRCRYRKIRCDGVLPSCKNCIKAKVQCMEVDKDTGIPRSHILELEERILWLEGVLRTRCPDFDLSRGPSIALRSKTTQPSSISMKVSKLDIGSSASVTASSPKSAVSPTHKRMSSELVSPISSVLDASRLRVDEQTGCCDPFSEHLSPTFTNTAFKAESSPGQIPNGTSGLIMDVKRFGTHTEGQIAWLGLQGEFHTSQVSTIKVGLDSNIEAVKSPLENWLGELQLMKQGGGDFSWLDNQL